LIRFPPIFSHGQVASIILRKSGGKQLMPKGLESVPLFGDNTITKTVSYTDKKIVVCTFYKPKQLKI